MILPIRVKSLFIAIVILVRTFLWGGGAAPQKCPCPNLTDYSYRKPLFRKPLHNRSFISFALTIGLIGSWYPSGLAQTESHLLVSELPPLPPRTPPPNQTRSGGSLNGGGTCRESDEPLIALAPEVNPVLTTSEHPTFLFYVPYPSEQVAYGEFTVNQTNADLDEVAHLYQARFTLPETPGIVSIRLPLESALQEDTYYHWYFKIYCGSPATDSALSSDDSDLSDLDVNGWVIRVPLTPDLEQQINAATPDIWYDSLAQLAEQLQLSPQDQVLGDRWRSLLETIGLEELAQEPLVGEIR
ncbi:MAG: DUF928 domain-containing protein [Cyanobacteria bacterium CRU_2_1]|nr:DUF928 domain-containing protein [Cyanobacteria bacterium CRU_2_1]